MISNFTVTELRGVRGRAHVRVWTTEDDHDERGKALDPETLWWHCNVSVGGTDGCPAMAVHERVMGRSECIKWAEHHAELLPAQQDAAIAVASARAQKEVKRDAE